MATVESIANDAIAAVGSDVSLLLAARWVNRRYQELVAQVKFRHLRKIGSFTVSGIVDDGTATATRGSVSVSGNAAAQAVWNNSLVGRFFRGRTAWYEIVQVTTGTATLILAQPFAEDTLTAGSYDIAARYAFLDPTVRWLGDIIFMRRRRPLDEYALDILNMLAPDRHLTTTGPQVYAEVGMGTDVNGQRARQIELYPYSDNDEVFYYAYWQEPGEIGLREDIPRVIEPYVLMEGTLVDIMRAASAKAAHVGQIDAAAFWRNEYRAQETKWKQYMRDAARTDRGVDDLTFILQTSQPHLTQSDITTAREHVLANWPR